MKYHFQGIAFKPRSVLVRPKTPKQNLEYDGIRMKKVKETLESIKELIQKRYEKKN